MLNFSEFVDYYARSSGLSKAKSKEEILRFAEIFKSATVENGGVSIPHFLKSYICCVSARKGVHPRTGDVINIPAKRVVKVKVLPAFRDMESRLNNDGE